jgi:hypothetical protein
VPGAEACGLGWQDNTSPESEALLHLAADTDAAQWKGQSAGVLHSAPLGPWGLMPLVSQLCIIRPATAPLEACGLTPL